MSKSMPKSLRFLEGLVGDLQFIDVPECLSIWKVQGTDLEMAFSCILQHVSEVS